MNIALSSAMASYLDMLLAKKERSRPHSQSHIEAFSPTG